LVWLVLAPATSPGKLQRKPSRKDNTLHWLMGKIWSLKGNGMRGIQRKESGLLVRRASCPLIGSGSVLPKRDASPSALLVRSASSRMSSPPVSGSLPVSDMRLAGAVGALVVMATLLKLTPLGKPFGAELRMAMLPVVCYVMLLLFMKPSSQKLRRKSSVKEQTASWLLAKIWSWKGSGLRGFSRTDSRLVRRASQPLIGTGSAMLPESPKGCKYSADPFDDASTCAGSEVGSPGSSFASSPTSSLSSPSKFSGFSL